MQAVNADVDEVMKRRERALRARTRALAEAPPMRVPASDRAPAAATPHMMLTATARATTKGWLVAEGDSWFDYPGADILDWLQQFGYDVESVARAGDRAEMMAFGRGQLDKFAAAVEKVIGRGETPKAVLLSAGGNDIAGAEFGFLLNHAGSPRQGLNESVVTGVVDERVHDAYLHIIARVTAVCERMLGTTVPILIHGYGYVVPDGDGVLGGWGPLPGPWLRPGFIEKGFNDLAANTEAMKQLMNRFNDMLQRVAAEFAHVRYINLRPVLPATKRLWANELHPKEQSFKLAAEKFAEQL
jgi:lysophospholipase L1-like esterase